MLVEVKASLGTELPVPLRAPGVSDKSSVMLLPCQGPLLVSNPTHQLLRSTSLEQRICRKTNFVLPVLEEVVLRQKQIR